MAGQKECAGYWTSGYCVIIVVAWRNGVGLCWRATQQGIARSGREECDRLAPAATSVAGAAYLGRLAHILFTLNALKTPRSAWIHPQILRRSLKLEPFCHATQGAPRRYLGPRYRGNWGRPTKQAFVDGNNENWSDAPFHRPNVLLPHRLQ